MIGLRMSNRLPEDVWCVIQEYLWEYRGIDAPDTVKRMLEERTTVETFDGGAFLSSGNEFDLFVVPEKRGRWRIRSVVGDYLKRLSEHHDTIVVKIFDRNETSLRLARHFGFKEVSRENGLVRLEKSCG